MIEQTKQAVRMLKEAGLNRSDFSVRTPKVNGYYQDTEITVYRMPKTVDDRLAIAKRFAEAGLYVNIAIFWYHGELSVNVHPYYAPFWAGRQQIMVTDYTSEANDYDGFKDTYYPSSDEIAAVYDSIAKQRQETSNEQTKEARKSVSSQLRNTTPIHALRLTKLYRVILESVAESPQTILSLRIKLRHRDGSKVDEKYIRPALGKLIRLGAVKKSGLNPRGLPDDMAAYVIRDKLVADAIIDSLPSPLAIITPRNS